MGSESHHRGKTSITGPEALVSVRARAVSARSAADAGSPDSLVRGVPHDADGDISAREPGGAVISRAEPDAEPVGLCATAISYADREPQPHVMPAQGHGPAAHR